MGILISKESFKVPKLPGKQVNSIIHASPSIFAELNGRRDPQLLYIWILWSMICFGYLEATNDELQYRSMSTLDEMLRTWSSIISERWFGKSLGYYYHILICHLPQLLQKFGSLQPYSNQGVEAHHQLNMLVKNRATSGNGKVSKKKVGTCVLMQLFLYPLRLRYLCKSYT